MCRPERRGARRCKDIALDCNLAGMYNTLFREYRLIYYSCYDLQTMTQKLRTEPVLHWETW